MIKQGSFARESRANEGKGLQIKKKEKMDEEKKKRKKKKKSNWQQWECVIPVMYCEGLY